LSFELNKHIGIALKISDTYYPLSKGIRRFKKISEPYIKSTFYIGNNCADTEVLGTRQYIRVNGTRFSGDAANDFIYGLYEKSGEECRTDAFFYNKETFANGEYRGYTVPVTVVMKSSVADSELKESPFIEFECDIYINGSGTNTQVYLAEV